MRDTGERYKTLDAAMEAIRDRKTQLYCKGCGIPVNADTLVVSPVDWRDPHTEYKVSEMPLDTTCVPCENTYTRVLALPELPLEFSLGDIVYIRVVSGVVELPVVADTVIREGTGVHSLRRYITVRDTRGEVWRFDADKVSTTYEGARSRDGGKTFPAPSYWEVRQ